MDIMTDLCARRALLSQIWPLAWALASSLVLAGCFGMLMQPRAPSAASDNAVAAQVRSAKNQADVNPGDSQAAVAFAELLGAAYDGGTVARGSVDGATMVPDALAKLDAAVDANPNDAAMLTAVKGNLLVKSGQPDAGVEQYEASLAIAPNLYALLPLIEVYTAQRRQVDIDAHCKATRPVVSSDHDRLFTLLHACASARPGMAPAMALPWASQEDLAFYQEQLDIERARAEARREEEARRRAEMERERQEAEAQRQAAAANNPPSGNAGGGGHYSAGVSVYNACSDKVRIFRGRVNGRYTGGGTYGWHSANSTTSYQLSGDDELCIVHNDRDIVSCTKPTSGARLEITSSCSGFTRR